jgi:hypothetical protein
MRKLSGELIVILVGVVCVVGVAITMYLARETSKYTIKTEFSTYCANNFRVYGHGVTFTSVDGRVVVTQGNFEIILNKK